MKLSKRMLEELDQDEVGHTIELNSVPFTIIGRLKLGTQLALDWFVPRVLRGLASCRENVA
jgi:hypothetical protein